MTVGPSATDIHLSNCLVNRPGQLTITTTGLPGGNVGAAYNQTLAAAGGVSNYVWSLNSGSNPLPAGLALNPSGVISGVPTAAGTRHHDDHHQGDRFSGWDRDEDIHAFHRCAEHATAVDLDPNTSRRNRGHSL
ncbi:MAG: hypothetical protein OJF50_005526 [Nitrospira sp.]|nr:hypothetical protein [Nitrospira sp.]